MFNTDFVCGLAMGLVVAQIILAVCVWIHRGVSADLRNIINELSAPPTCHKPGYCALKLAGKCHRLRTDEDCPYLHRNPLET